MIQRGRCVVFQRDSQPTQLANGRWNCSGPEWPKFKPHLGCNLKLECEGGEDEAHCRYSPCRDGGFQLEARLNFLEP